MVDPGAVTMTDWQSPEQDRPLALRIADACSRGSMSLQPDDILAALQSSVPEIELKYATARTGWHRLGGVVDAHFQPVASHFREWAEEKASGDIERLTEICARVGGFGTRLEGSTHYLTAITGERAQDFIQVEVEQMEEVLERPLWDPDWVPEDFEDFIDPSDAPRLEPEPVGPPRLLFRRHIRVGDFVESEDTASNVKRFFLDWDRSSAGDSARFCDFWILGIQEYRDICGDGRIQCKPVPLLTAEVPELPDELVEGERTARGAALANLIHGFDREVGYHFAWYFHMLTRRRVSYKLAEAVHADLMGAFDYLPARDIAVLRDWYEAPYSA